MHHCTWLGLLDDAALDVLLGPLDVVGVHLVQLSDGDVVVDPCAELLDHNIGSELLMLSFLWFVNEDVVYVLLHCSSSF